MSAMVAAALALGGQLQGERAILLIDSDAAAGSLVEASPKIPLALATEGSFWGDVLRISASSLVERAPPVANPADAPRKIREPYLSPQARRSLASFQEMLQLCQILPTPGTEKTESR